ncbi:MAG: chitobiase/beta-hexosaminidase C-terminal domain-containing protein [Acidobacteriota bacterium]
MLSLCVATLGLAAQTPTAIPVTTWRYDLTHSGANTKETALTPANVASNAFGKLFSLSVDDRVFAQPLYVPNLKMSDGKVHNVLFVATENDTIYAFDADTKGNPIWKISLLTAAYGAGAGATPVPQSDVAPSEDIGPNIGITGTPAIDPATNTMYVVTNTKENGQYYSRLHAINILSGAEQPNGHVDITATVPGTGDGSSGGQVSFSALWTNQRAALDFYNGYVYIAYSSHGDISPYHGWLFAYNASTLKQTAALCLSPSDLGASVWGAGAGLPIDTKTNKLFIVTANGDRNTPFKSTSDYGESVVAFNIANGQLTPVDEWTTFNYKELNTPDNDLGSGGLLMLPDQPGSYPHEILAAGKEGRISILNRDNLGGLASGSNSNAIQDFQIGSIQAGEGFWGTAAYWNGNVYDWAGGDGGGTPNVGMQFKLTNGTLTTTPTSQTTFTSAFPGPTFSVSSNGTQDGIVWAVKADQFNSWGPAVLYAFDPDDLSNVLYESDTNTSDRAGPANKFAVPVVTNGKVYVPTNGEVDVYGLTIAQPTAATPSISPDGGTFTTAQSVTISSTTNSAIIYYTVDGSTPTTTSTEYTGPITVSTDTTVKAMATAPGYTPSAVSSATFTFSNQVTAPTFSPAPGTYLNAQAVTLADADANAQIYYTTDGSTPTSSSTPYTSPIQVGASETIKAIAIDPALANSNVAAGDYVIQSGATGINFANGFNSTSGLTLTGSTAASNSQILLTNGGTNQAGSFFWNAPINIQAFTTQFEFQLTDAAANGFTFTIQNVGPSAIGGGSAGLGYQDIRNSVAVKFNFYNYQNEGGNSTGIYTAGQAPVTPSIDITPSGIKLASGDKIRAQISYDGTTLSLNLVDESTNATFTTSQAINIPQTVGSNTAYVGFTGATGGLSANQAILTWTYNTQAVAPAFGPPAGSYSATQNVTLSSQTADAKIFYTTDGSTPTSSSTQYSSPIQVATSETVKAVAISSTLGASNVTAAAYVIGPGGSSTPSFSLQGSPVNVSAGGSASATISVTPNGGFTGSVSLTCSITGNSGAANPPTCAVAQPPAISGSQPVNANIAINTQASTSAGNYTLNVTGTSGQQTASTTVDLTIAPPSTGSGAGQFALTGTAINIPGPGASGTSTITITPSGGFTGTVALSCAIATGPNYATDSPACSVTQPPAIKDGQAVTATLTLSTSPAPSPAASRSLTGLGGGTALAALFLLFIPRRRSWRAFLGLFLLGAFLVGVSGCGSKVAAGPYQTTGGTTPGAYTLTITGTSGSLQATTTIDVEVQ